MSDYDDGPSGTFEGTIAQSQSMRVKYIIGKEIPIQERVKEVHREFGWSVPLWCKEGVCIIKEFDVKETVWFSGFNKSHISMMSPANHALGVVRFVYNAKERTVCGGDESWDPKSKPTIRARQQASNTQSGGDTCDLIVKADEELQDVGITGEDRDNNNENVNNSSGRR